MWFFVLWRTKEAFERRIIDKLVPKLVQRKAEVPNSAGSCDYLKE